MDRVAKLDWLNCQISLWDVPDVTYSIYIVALVFFGGNSILITKPCTSLHELRIPTLKDQPDQCLVFELARMSLHSLFSWSSLFPLPVCHIWSIAWQMSVAIDCRFQTCVVFEILLICNLAFCQHCAWWLSFWWMTHWCKSGSYHQTKFLKKRSVLLKLFFFTLLFHIMVHTVCSTKSWN